MPSAWTESARAIGQGATTLWIIARASGSYGQIPHEDLVDLQLVELEFAKIAERRIPRAEIIQCQPEAFFPERIEDRHRTSRRPRRGRLPSPRARSWRHRTPASHRPGAFTDATRSRSFCLNWTGDRFIDSVRSGQLWISTSACLIIQSLMGLISPHCSAIGMKTPGEIGPSLCHGSICSRASTPTIAFAIGTRK